MHDRARPLVLFKLAQQLARAAAKIDDPVRTAALRREPTMATLSFRLAPLFFTQKIPVKDIERQCGMTAPPSSRHEARQALQQLFRPPGAGRCPI